MISGCALQDYPSVPRNHSLWECDILLSATAQSDVTVLAQPVGQEAEDLRPVSWASHHVLCCLWLWELLLPGGTSLPARPSCCPSETHRTFTNKSSLNHVQRAFCSYLNICLGCVLLHRWIPSPLSGPSWGEAWAPASGWGVWRWRARPLTQYCCWLE